MARNNIGQLVKRFRLERRMTLQEIANELDVHYQTVINWESGEVQPIELNEYQILRMFKAHGFAHDELAKV